MAEYLEMHPQTPQIRLIRKAVDILRGGGVVAYPTDSCYALGCHVGDKDALERIRRIRDADKHHNFTLVCRNLAEIGRYAQLDTWQFRLVKAHIPGPFTFLLPATRETPKRLQHPKRRTIGIRVPDHPVPHLIMAELNEPIMTSTLLLPGDDEPLTDGAQIAEHLGHQLDAVVDAGHCGTEPTTVIDLSVSPAVVLRQGKGVVRSV
jgi:tRNA threonylcarbamoyl adenosine modification protein (Sua5/YciO/YrdC/YwlC family)